MGVEVADDATTEEFTTSVQSDMEYLSSGVNGKRLNWPSWDAPKWYLYLKYVDGIYGWPDLAEVMIAHERAEKPVGCWKPACGPCTLSDLLHTLSMLSVEAGCLLAAGWIYVHPTGMRPKALQAIPHHLITYRVTQRNSCFISELWECVPGNPSQVIAWRNIATGEIVGSRKVV